MMNIKEKLCGNCKYWETEMLEGDTLANGKVAFENKVCANRLSDEYDHPVAYEHSCDDWVEITEE